MSENMEEVSISIEELEHEIKNNKTLIARADALQRLEKNADFILLIQEGFLEQHAIRQVMLKAHPGYRDEKHQDYFDLQIAGCGALKQFFISIFAEGNRAKQELMQAEQTLSDIHEEIAEGADNVQ